MKNRLFVIIFSLLVVLCALMVFWGKYYHGNAAVAKITVDGAVYQTIDLSEVTEAYTVELIDQAGRHNTVLVQPGQIQMQSADCPDQLCVKQGSISTGAYPIVCLPNKVVISLERGEDAPDAFAGR